MGLFIRQDENRSELQSKIATELREKTRVSAEQLGRDVDPRFLENQHETRPLGFVIGLLLVVIAIAVVVYVATQTN